MNERQHIVAALVREVLGPRNGPREEMPADRDPRNEYITGILGPSTGSPWTVDGEMEPELGVPASESDADEGEAGDDQGGAPVTLSSALDPRALPRSIGLTFVVASETSPGFDVCCTWGTYQELTEGGWKRIPEHVVVAGVGVEENSRSRVLARRGDVELWMRTSRPDGALDGAVRVSLFLVNAAEHAGEGSPHTTQLVFQPQIRVQCGEGTHLLPVRDRVTDEDEASLEKESYKAEQKTLSLMYRTQSGYARGHMCSATWRTVDPEVTWQATPEPADVPFVWIDGETLEPGERQHFSPAAVRTDLVPLSLVLSPDLSWPDSFGQAPILEAAVLAELWDANELADALRPLTEGYGAWIDQEDRALERLSSSERELAARNVVHCRLTLERMESGLSILHDDPDVRLAFCFANKAMALQTSWRGRRLEWRPFQLAFILLNIPAMADPTCEDRGICDLLWVPTGGGKTEAYLGLVAFTIGLRRLRARSGRSKMGGAGVAVLSRYTLRLLTIQQFRRALSVVTACEYLRVDGLDRPGGPVGWRPSGCVRTESPLWGGVRFAAGLWVGGNAAPNHMHSTPVWEGGRPVRFMAGAIDILKGVTNGGYEGPDARLKDSIQPFARNVTVEGEPAQVLSCPCCGAVLAVPHQGLSTGVHGLHFVYSGGGASETAAVEPPPDVEGVSIEDWGITEHDAPRFKTLSLRVRVAEGVTLSSEEIDRWWWESLAPALGGAVLEAARPSRPGYFILSFGNTQGNRRACDFDIYCPNPRCELNQHAWAEQVPLSRNESGVPQDGSASASSTGIGATRTTAALPVEEGFQYQAVPAPFQLGRGRPVSRRIPIPGLTVDDQVYHRCPSLVVATADKFARLAYEPKAASLFGYVTHYHSRGGYYREGAPPNIAGDPGKGRDHPPGYGRGRVLHVHVPCLAPPDLVIQDELHLLEGPLGSMAGLYEAAIDLLCEGTEGGGSRAVRPKYVASTATARQAATQIRALFDRELCQFPSWGTSAGDRFFSRDPDGQALDRHAPGRLYLGICAPGKGAQTPVVRIWASLLQKAYEVWKQSPDGPSDSFYTLVGYFNAIRELAGARTLYDQDIPDRMRNARAPERPGQPKEPVELSSSQSSTELPGMLEKLAVPAPDAPDAVLATSMFGTGVDVDRLGLMVVHGQPKTSASYIQATGRVGRQHGGLVVCFLRASRARDLDHYEFFVGYHRALYRHVEPVTVAPFSPRARERALGILAVILLRQACSIGGHRVSPNWMRDRRQGEGPTIGPLRMASCREDDEVRALPSLLEARAKRQPAGRIPVDGAVEREMAQHLDRWKLVAQRHLADKYLVYWEPSIQDRPTQNVVLGDPQHEVAQLDQVIRNAQQSLREVEATTRIGRHEAASQAIRGSQFVTTYGPASLLETTGGPCVITSLDVGGVYDTGGIASHEIPDPRLSSLTDGGARLVRLPSNADLGRPDGSLVYRANRFPSWSLCVRHGVLYQKRTSDNKSCPFCAAHTDANAAWERANRDAIRFVLACPDGHLDDVPWRRVPEHKRDGCSPSFLLWRGGGSSSLRDISIECSVCGGAATLASAYYRDWPCTGRAPQDEERGAGQINRPGCRYSARMVQRGAANLRIPEIITALTIPPWHTPLHRALRLAEIPEALLAVTDDRDELIRNLDRLGKRGRLAPERVDAVLAEVERCSEDEVREALRACSQDGLPSSTEELLEQELDALCMAATYGERAVEGASGRPGEFEVLQEHVRVFEGPAHRFRLRVAPVSRLRVVMAQTGFRRLDSANSLVSNRVEVNGSEWLPGVELFGEGIFVDVEPPNGEAWSPARDDLLGQAASDWYVEWREYAARQVPGPFPARCLHPVFVWWHTLAHRLIRALAVDSGYSSAAVRERVLVKIDGDSGKARGGVLLYTVQPGGDGTLGGLEALAADFKRVLDVAFHDIDGCSNDPLCSEQTVTARRYNGAACYACAMVSETSCEYRNLFLDRNVLIDNLP